MGQNASSGTENVIFPCQHVIHPKDRAKAAIIGAFVAGDKAAILSFSPSSPAFLNSAFLQTQRRCPCTGYTINRW